MIERYIALRIVHPSPLELAAVDSVVDSAEEADLLALAFMAAHPHERWPLGIFQLVKQVFPYNPNLKGGDGDVDS